MTPLVSLTAALAELLGPPVDLEQLTVERCRALSGRPVVATFTVSGPVDYYGEYAFLPVGHEDDVERVVLVSESREVRRGDVLTLPGVLTVRDHPPAVVNGVTVPHWVDVVVR